MHFLDTAHMAVWVLGTVAFMNIIKKSALDLAVCSTLHVGITSLVNLLLRLANDSIS